MKVIREMKRELDCPLCNGLIQVKKSCARCGENLMDGGPVESYFGPYSPYEEVDDKLQDFLPEYRYDECLHLFYCPACGWDKRYGITKIDIE